MTYQEAKKIALEIDEDFNACHEYRDAFVFFVNGAEHTMEDRILVVMKETGETTNWVSFIVENDVERNPIILDFETGKEMGVLKYDEDEEAE